MSAPDSKSCSEEELWRYVASHLETKGIGTVLVGGGVVAIYTDGLYRSGDLDLIAEERFRKRLPDVLAKIGFLPSKSRYFKHPECEHLFLDFPPGPVEIGEEYPVTPASIEHEGRPLKILSPTDCVKDRLAGYIHWKSRANFEQAVLVCRSQHDRIDLRSVERWCRAENAGDTYRELAEALNR